MAVAAVWSRRTRVHGALARHHSIECANKASRYPFFSEGSIGLTAGFGAGLTGGFNGAAAAGARMAGAEPLTPVGLAAKLGAPGGAAAPACGTPPPMAGAPACGGWAKEATLELVCPAGR